MARHKFVGGKRINGEKFEWHRVQLSWIDRTRFSNDGPLDRWITYHPQGPQ